MTLRRVAAVGVLFVASFVFEPTQPATCDDLGCNHNLCDNSNVCNRGCLCRYPKDATTGFCVPWASPRNLDVSDSANDSNSK